MNPEFVLVDNIIHQMMGDLYKMLKLFKGYPDTPTLTEAMTGTYKAECTQDVAHEI